MDILPLLLYLGTGLALCCGFSVDVDLPTAFQVPTRSFGSSVAQIGNMPFVGAPFQTGQANETGKLYQCAYRTGDCKEINVQRPADAVNMSLGFSLAAQASQVLVCGPTVQRACGKNMYVNGYCFLLDQTLQQLQRFPETLPECAPHPTDIVFLIDGSGSIRTRDFRRMKEFVSNVITRLSGRNTLFALMQFSDDFMEHFDFRAEDPARRVMDVEQIGGWTHTATAIHRVVNQLFTPRKGSRREATKILIVITDGEKARDPLEYWNVIPEADRAGIIRYAIGVGRAFSTTRAQNELDTIASSPSSEHVFAVHDFDALRGIQDKLQDKIFAIEGTQSQSTSSFQMEMSQEGFSALLTPDGPVLGAVGAYDWSGGVFLYQGSNRYPSFINISSTSTDMNDAYLERRGFVLGAPRFNHIGKVVVFEKQARSREWQLTVEAIGEQVGSYFGATLCSVDLDRDSNTDLVLVGAPMYYDAVTGGRVYVCHFKEEGLQCSTTLKGQEGHVFGHFGASMAEIGDVTGDRWTDVVIGAPMEDKDMGALYIFAGKRTSLSLQYSQRIEGLRFSGGFFYFGQSVSGGTDLTGDGLPDLTVGRQGQVLLLRSRPVLQVGVSVVFQPPVIPTSAFQCQGQEPHQQVASTVKICFAVTKATRDALGNVFSNLQYGLALDSERSKIRASFSNKSPVLNGGFRTGLEQKCQNHQIELPICIKDTLTPITLRLNYSLQGMPIAEAQGLRPVLREGSQQVYIAQLPFEKNCGTDGKCEDRLQTSFNFSGLDTLVVGLTPELNVIASVQNYGEDSYSTTLRFFYPAGVSYRKVTLLQPSRKVMSVKCNSAPASEEDAERNATCNINHPIFWSGAEATFVATFDVSLDADLGDTLRIMAKANSENGGDVTADMVHQAELPVRYAVYVIVTAAEESTKYVNFTSSQGEASASVEHRYEVKNLRKRSIPILVTFQIPQKLNGIQIWNVSRVIPSKLPQPQLATCVLERETAGDQDVEEKLKKHPLVDCSVATCKTIRCDILSLKMWQPVEFTVKGNISFQWASQTQQQKLILVSSAQISYDNQKYTQKEGFVSQQVQTVVERIEVYNYLPAILGGTFAGLVLLAIIAAALYKVGFFKRQYKEMLSDAGEGDGAPSPAQEGTDSSPPDKGNVY
ncbi:PREDICTED: integrin alpha-X-like [Gekko japonicus]|uniref:Integrin alpha-X-like n=1 Tax=Gekko japonicus TaxID=146911 RepID=A0ABM1JK14_GEKJA|nr:PREDICTED: integrin alpha-X-like [Gekko japonicus]